LAKSKTKSKSDQPRLSLETGQKGRIGVLRDLRQIQLSVPDKYFFVNKFRGKGRPAAQPDSGGFLSGILGGRKPVGLDIMRAVELVKTFHNTFQTKTEGSGIKKTSDSGVMSVSAMNDYRKEVKEAAAAKNADFRWKALEAIVRFIDLKNSGLVQDKMLILQDCLRQIGLALHEDGGLSMFHATWFLTIYKDYLSAFRMFRRGEVENIDKNGGREGRTILKRLLRRQLEIPFYLHLVDDKQPEIKQLIKYAKDERVKRSLHGQQGCTRQHIRQVFQEAFKGQTAETTRRGGLNEIGIVMSYALLMTRIPMMYEVVEAIKSAIPKVCSETELYRHKIGIAQKSVLLDIARVIFQAEGSEEGAKKLYQLVIGVFRHCVDVVSEHHLLTKVLESAIYTHPLMKAASLLIVHRRTLSRNQDSYLEMLERATGFLQPVKKCSQSGDQALIRIAGYAELYEEKLRSIAHELRTQKAADS